MKTKIINFLYLLLLFFTVVPKYTSAQMVPERPRVGVVLSGGGAKGFAHIPILKMIDSLGIPVDYVAGTSMGAVVGALYSIGYTPQQIEDMVLEENWGAILDDTPLRRNVPIMEKDIKQNRLASVGVKSKKNEADESKIEVLIPAGFIAGQDVFDKILFLTNGFHQDQNFLSFPKGFLCVAADLRTGKEVVFTSGSLPQALRSTMSIPTMFSPNVYDGKMLVDGGAINNFPSDHLKALGCDIIIGVNVSAPFSRVEDHPSFADVLGQTGMFIDSESSEKRKALCDVYIEPDVFEYGITSFGAKKEILEKGQEAVEKKFSELKAIADQFNDYLKPAQTSYKFPDSIIVTEVIFNGLKNLSPQYVASKFDIPLHQKIAYSFLDEKNKEFFGTGKVEQSHFFLYQTNTPGQYSCEIVINEKQSETVVGVGLHYDSDLKTGILLSADVENLLFKGSQLLANFVISERPRLRMTYLLDAGRSFGFGIDVNMHLFSNSLYQSRRFIGRYQHFDKYVGVYALRTIENSAVLKWGAGLNHSGYDMKDVPSDNFWDSLGVGGMKDFEFMNIGPFIDLTVDRLDNASVPSIGVYARLRGNYVAPKGDNDLIKLPEKAYLTINGQWKNVWPAFKRFTIISDVHFGANLFNRPSPTYFNLLGGAGDYFFNNQIPFLGYRYQELFIRQFVTTGALNFRYKVMPQVYASYIVNVAVHNNEWNDFRKLDHKGGMGLKMIWMTPFGPVSGTLHRSFEAPELLAFVSIGFNF